MTLFGAMHRHEAWRHCLPKGAHIIMYTANAIRNICLLGHSGSGKSALAESLLYMTGAIDRMGKNADGNTVKIGRAHV